MITFMTTLYNEEHEIEDLINHVIQYVDMLVLVDDGSTDSTAQKIFQVGETVPSAALKIFYEPIEHIGSCELGRIEALKLVPEQSWVIMLDADERFGPGVLQKIVGWINSNPEETHMWFNQMEFIDGIHTRTYQKVKVFKKEVAHLPEIIHGDPQFDGKAHEPVWTVLHRKTSDKQIMREREYLAEYRNLEKNGIIDEGKRKWFEGMHYFVRSNEEIPHG